MRIHRSYLSCVLAMALFSAATTQAVPTYRVVGNTGISVQFGRNEVFDEYDVTSFGSPTQGGVFYNGELDFPSILASGSSSASIFGLGASAYARAINAEGGVPLTNNFTVQTGTFAEATWSDFMVTGPAGQATVSISLNVFLEGSITTSLAQSSAQFDRAIGSVQLGILANGRSFGGDYGEVHTKSAGVTSSGGGLLAGFDGSSLVTTPFFNVPVNTPFSLRLQLTTYATVDARLNEIYIMEAVTSFGNTLTFAPSGPVFNLPAGYTINSVDAGIVNNAYVAVPETSAMGLSALSVGVIFLGVFARRRRQRELCP